MTSMARRFREILAGPHIQSMPMIYNAAGALLAAKVGYSFAGFGGSGITCSLLGLADVGFVTLTEVEYVVSRAAAVSPIPLFVDADTGYGNAVGVTHSVRCLERAGVAAIMIEDQTSPPRSGAVAGAGVISAQEMVGKIKAAVDTRRDQDFFILARTDARKALGIEEAIERGNLYAEAGADGFFADAMASSDELRQVSEGVPGIPKFGLTILNEGAPHGVPLGLADLEMLGFSCAFITNSVARASGLGGLEYLDAIKRRGMCGGETVPTDLDLSEFGVAINWSGAGPAQRF
jgi:2-methylisocitrate lyase-like PEP mutase family enzyme